MEELEQLISAKFNQNMPPSAVMGKAVDIAGDRCRIVRVGKADILDVRLDAALGVSDDFIRITPKENSIVACLVIEGNPADATIIKYSQVQKIEIMLGGAELIIEGGKFSIGNSAAKLKSILKTGLDQVKNAIIIVPNGTGQLSPSDKLVLQQQSFLLDQLFI